MDDLRKRAIQGIECWIEWADNSNDFDLNKCADCTYKKEFRCLPLVMKDALELIKREEPRVMTLDEVHEMAWDYCYLEEEVIKDKVLQIYSGKYRIKCITWPSIASCVLTFGDEAYGKRWRCWTSRPTDEQRAVTPWEPPKEGT